MTIDTSLNQSMNKAVQHYSSLFKLPTYKTILLIQALVCVGGGFLSLAILFRSFEGMVNGLLFGTSLFFTTLVVDCVASVLILRHELIYDLRRIAGLSLFCWGLWLLFIFVGVAIALPFGLVWWTKSCLLGFSAVIILRLIVLFSTSPMNYKRLFVAAIFQPFFCVVPFLVFWLTINYAVISFLPFLIIAPVIGLISCLLFMSSLNSVGKRTFGFSSLSLFKAFLLNWVVDLNVPFEEFLEKLGENQDVEVSLIYFGSSKPKTIMAVPSIHPGPFKNIGSSLLPSMLKAAVEKEFNCVACVPHGLLGHEFDLASQIQTQKIINHITRFTDIKCSKTKTTPFVKVSNGLATACCQIFGDCAFLSFTLAPKTTEDLSQELGLFVCTESKKYGLNCCIVVNAHNSIDGTVSMQEALDALKKVGVECLQKAVSLKQLPFQIGVASVLPSEMGLKEGMGSGGITTVVVNIAKQKTAYVVIDGNNMVSGLREKILSALNFMGVDEGEVFTTDTHSVNAVILGNRGYHPIGEVIDHDALIKYIKETISAALSNLEHANAECQHIIIPDVKVIGGKQLEALCLLIDRALHKAKRVAPPLFATSGLLLMLILTYL